MKRQDKIFGDDRILLCEVQDRMFKKIGQCESNGSINLYTFKQTTWQGKCDPSGIYTQTVTGKLLKPDPYNEYKQMLALKLYQLYGIKVPECVLSKQIISQSSQKIFEQIFKKQIPSSQAQQLHLKTPRIHSMTHLKQYEQEPELIQKYFQSHDEIYKVKNDQYELYGFGSMLAVANLLGDYRCVGTASKNVRYVLEKTQNLSKYARIVKINGSQALSFELASHDNPKQSQSQNVGSTDRQLCQKQFRKTNQLANYNPKQKYIILSSRNNLKISFQSLNQHDQKQYIEMIRKILHVGDTKIKSIFDPFIKIDERFRQVLMILLERKVRVIKAYADDLDKYLREKIAANLFRNWNNSENQFIKNNKEYQTSLSLLSIYLLVEHGNIEEIPSLGQKCIKREQQLQKIKTMLKKSGKVIICGGLRCGKTHLAAQYLNCLSVGVRKFWFNIELQKVQEQLVNYMQKKYPQSQQIKKFSDLVQKFYNQIGINSILVFDGVSDLVLLKQFTQKAQKPQMIIIMRSNLMLEGPVVTVGNFRQREVVDYCSQMFQNTQIVKNLKQEKVINEEEENTQSKQIHDQSKKDYITLSRMLDNFPSAIIEVIEYLKKYVGANFLPRQLQIIKQNKQKLLDIMRNTFSSVIIQLFQLKNKHSKMLNILTYLSPSLTTKYFLQKIDSNSVQVLLNRSILTIQENNRLKFNKVYRYALELINRKSRVCAEALVKQYIVSKNKKPSQDKEQWVNIFCKVGNQFLLADRAKEAQQIFKKCLQIMEYQQPQLNPQSSLKNSKKEFLPQISKILTSLGSIYGQLGLYDKQIKILTRALDMKINLYGQNHKETSITLSNLSAAYLMISDDKKSQQFLQKSRQLKKSYTNYDPLQSIPFLINISILYSRKEKYEQQQKILEQCKKLIVDFSGNNDIRLGSIDNNLALCLRNQGKEEYKNFLEKAFQIYKQNNKNHNSPQMAIIYNNLGIICQSSKFGSIDEQTKKAKQIKYQWYQKDHPETALTIANFGYKYLSQNNVSLGFQYLLSAYKIIKDYNNSHQNKVHVKHFQKIQKQLMKFPSTQTKCFANYEELKKREKDKLDQILICKKISWDILSDLERFDFLKQKKIPNYSYLKSSFIRHLSQETQADRHKLRQKNQPNTSNEQHWTYNLDANRQLEKITKYTINNIHSKSQ